MRNAAFGLLAVVVCALGTMACSDRLPTDPTRSASAAENAAAGPGRSRGTIVIPPRGIDLARFGTWGSDVASLTIQPAGAMLRVLGTNLGSGGCYGSFGEVARSIPIGRFAFPGTFVQLTGVYPGRIEYEAGYEGVIDGDVMTLTVTVPSLPRVLGPYRLVYGVSNAWTPCLYP
jgi:hypothetical protein